MTMQQEGQNMELATIASIFAWAENTWGDVPDYPFKDEATAVLRHPINRKWYALVWTVDGRHVGEAPGVMVDVMNIKADPLIAVPLYHQHGFMPAYHMNKEKWMTVLLNGTVPLSQVTPLLEMSHALTDTKPRRRRQSAD